MHKPLCELRISVLRTLREEKAVRGIQPDEYDPELVASISNNWVQVCILTVYRLLPGAKPIDSGIAQ